LVDLLRIGRFITYLPAISSSLSVPDLETAEKLKNMSFRTTFGF
jgi:hypothetical protein